MNYSRELSKTIRRYLEHVSQKQRRFRNSQPQITFTGSYENNVILLHVPSEITHYGKSTKKQYKRSEFATDVSYRLNMDHLSR